MERKALLAFLRPGVVWVNKHNGDETTITDFASRVERVPVATGGFEDDPQLVVHHTANVPPGFTSGYGDDARTFVEHWVPGDAFLDLPPDLLRVLRDPTISIPRDHEIRLADGRTLWEHLNDWRNAPSDTASAAGGDV